MSDQTPKTEDKPQAAPTGELSEKEKLKKAQKEAAKAAKLAKLEEKERKLQEQKKAKEAAPADKVCRPPIASHTILHTRVCLQNAKAKPVKKEAEKEAPFVNTTPVGEKKGLSPLVRSNTLHMLIAADLYRHECTHAFWLRARSCRGSMVLVVGEERILPRKQQEQQGEVCNGHSST